jgi:hypothetical protein
MRRRDAIGALAAAAATASHVTADRVTKRFPLTSLDGIELMNTKGETGSYKGRRAVRLVNSGDGENIAILKDSAFEDGMIEVDLAGSPRAGSDTSVARGFIGVAFRVQKGGSRFECFYIRPTNGRANDQLRRNHSTQYISSPDYPWQKLRQENPGVYESYCDLEAGAWTHVKIHVSGVEAQLFVNGAAQPCLIVNDLKMGKVKGQIALWVGVDTDGWFSHLTVTA